jgi:hypothetical protein
MFEGKGAWLLPLLNIHASIEADGAPVAAVGWRHLGRQSSQRCNFF